MKKKIIGLTLAGAIALSGVVSASSLWGSYKGNPIIRLTVNGVPTKVSDAPAINYNNRTMVPIYLLKEAGINYTWDQNNQTVNIAKPTGQIVTTPTQSPSSEKIKAYAKAMNYFKQAVDLTNQIKGLSSTLSTAYSGLVINNTSSLDKQAGYINTTVAQYNNLLKLYNSLVPEMNRYGISISEGNDILTMSYNAIESFKKSLDALYSFNASKSNTDFSNYLTNSSQGFDTAFDGLDLANKNYNSLFSSLSNL